MWDSGIADDALWERLHASFTTEELVELGFFVGLTLGQQRWIKTLDLRHHEVLPGTGSGLAAEASTRILVAESQDFSAHPGIRGCAVSHGPEIGPAAASP